MTDQQRKKPSQRARRTEPLSLAIAAMIATLGVFAQETRRESPRALEGEEHRLRRKQ